MSDVTFNAISKFYYCLTFYQNIFTTQSHKTDERVLREMMHRNVKCIDEDDRLSLIIYHKNKETK